MEESALFALIEKGPLEKWWAEAEARGYRAEEEQRVRDRLLELLPEGGRTVLDNYSIIIEDKTDYRHFYMHAKVLHLGVQIGMELQKAFLESE